jgi:hypothetical protein
MVFRRPRARRGRGAAAAALLLVLSAALPMLALTSAHAAAAPADRAAPAALAASANPAATPKAGRSAKPTGAPRTTAPPVIVQESGIVVDSSDPAPFAAQGSGSAATATDAPAVEPVGALSGISLGSWLELWPILLAVNLLALAALARIVVRSPAPRED